MKWKYKSILHRFFSTSFMGASLHYWIQKRFTKSLPTKIEKYDSIITLAKEHVSSFNKYSSHKLSESLFYEFGAGWDLLIPLIFYSIGVEKQFIIDIRPLARLELINDTIDKLKKMPNNLITRKPLNLIGKSLADDLKAHYGIEYHAPCDARTTKFMPDSIHCITSTNTLEHIPEDAIRDILRECHRILKSDGIMSMKIDYQDHYSYFDNKISAYNFLIYSDREWKRYCPETHYQNRLRHYDYLNMFIDAGFELLEDRTKEGSQKDLEIIRRLPIDARFKKYSVKELAVRNSSLIFRKKSLNVLH